jgi:hypothetical protein
VKRCSHDQPCRKTQGRGWGLGLLVPALACSCSSTSPGSRAEPLPAAAQAAPAATSAGAAAAGAPASGASYRSVLIERVPFIRQQPDFCGEAVAASALRALGRPYDQEDVFAFTGMDPARGMGATTRELKVALDAIGFKTGGGWALVAADEAAPGLERQFAALHADLGRGIPSIVCTHFDSSPGTTEHFRLVLGYDAERDEIIYHDPALDQGAYLRMTRERLLALWPLQYTPERWTVIRLRLEPGTLRDPLPRRGRGPAELAQHVRRLRSTLPESFSVVVEPPFVVIGDEPAAQVRERAESTVRWAVARLKQDYFAEDPKEILDVWLFADAESYRSHAKRLFGGEPHTPYGYYSEKHHALVMNIATGGGTLVHEIVHPFMETNFPSCPAWFNEGLGSLYEQSSSRDGHIVGLTNWRLAGLQRAIRAGGLPSFEALSRTSSTEFYEQDPGTHYAQARYLAYYLQEQGLLVPFYQRFRTSAAQDPTGYQTLRAVLGHPDMAVFQRQWERYVLGLRFP